jgi:hypothetical protein
VQSAVDEPTPAPAPKAASNHSTTEDWLNSPPHTSVVFPDIPKSIVDEFSSKPPEENVRFLKETFHVNLTNRFHGSGISKLVFFMDSASNFKKKSQTLLNHFGQKRVKFTK